MQFIHEKTELGLHQFLEEIEPRPQTWRVINIEFQDCDIIRTPLFQNLLLRNIPQFFAETDARIFWHKPGFILVFFKGRVLPIETCVEKLLKETDFKGVRKFFDILDLSIHWATLLQIMDQVTLPQAMSVQPTGSRLSKHEINQDEFKVTLSEDRIGYLKASREARVKPVILLVEDDALILQLVKSIVEKYFDVVFAETARQAIIYYQRHLPDMVFMDIHLPDGNGMDLLQDIKDADDESYIVMLSAQSQQEKIRQALEIGAKAFLPKPFTRSHVSDAVDQFFNNKKLHADSTIITHHT